MLSDVVDSDTIIKNYLKVLEFGEKYSGCSKAHLGAGLFSKTDNYEPILGANGVIKGSCRKKDICTRERGYDLQKEFRTCPSACAEATVLFGMIFYLPVTEVENSYLISARTPCERCTAYMIMYAEKEIINDLYVGGHKNGKPRDKDSFHLDILIASGMNVHLIKPVGGGYKIVDVKQAHDLRGPYYKELGLRLPNPVPYGHIKGNNLPLSRTLSDSKRKKFFEKVYEKWK